MSVGESSKKPLLTTSYKDLLARSTLNILMLLLLFGPVFIASVLSGGFAIPIWALALTVFGGLANLAWFSSTIRNIYKNYWLRFLFWLSNTRIMGGRAYVGERVRMAQRVRLFANTLIITVFFSAVSFSTILTGGLAFPLWAMILMGGALIINFFALPITSSGNTVKIQTYYDTEWELQTLNNEKGQIEQEPPHGILHSGAAQSRMLMLRYLHDLNGLLGTLASWLVGLYDFLVPWFSIFAPLVAGILMITSRISGALSAGGAPFTYKKRLSVHTQNINDQINVYYDICNKKTLERHKQVNRLFDKILTDYPIKKTKYYEWLKFRCYCAIERALQEGIAESSIAAIVSKELNSICDSKRDKTYEISRNKLRDILKKEKGSTLAVLDALPVFEEKLYQKLKCASPVDLSSLRNQFATHVNGHRDLFVNYFKSAWLKKYGHFNNLTITSWAEKLKKMPFIKYSISSLNFDFDVAALKEHEEWAINTSHGKQLLPTYHIKKLAYLLVEQCAVTKEATAGDETEEKLADTIWLKVVPKNAEGEYDYDDHETSFQGAMFFMKEYLVTELKKDRSFKNQDKLKEQLQAFIKLPGITQESSVKKTCGFAYKTFNLKTLHTFKTSYATPWLTEASAIESRLQLRV